MKLIKADKDRIWFQLPDRQKQRLAIVLGAYPLVPETHQKLSRTVTNPEAEKLLQEATASQRRENKERIAMFLTALQPHEDGYRLVLQSGQIEWLLQVLNDVRVGSWLLLGSPKDQLEALKNLNPTIGQYFWYMEVAGEFEHKLLYALAWQHQNQQT